VAVPFGGRGDIQPPGGINSRTISRKGSFLICTELDLIAQDWIEAIIIFVVGAHGRMGPLD
jgi:hypothetical protein